MELILYSFEINVTEIIDKGLENYCTLNLKMNVWYKRKNICN